MPNPPIVTSLRTAMTEVPKSSAGNDPWAENYGREMKQLLRDYAARFPRSLQRHLGPSELGEKCTRNVVAKMAGTAAVPHVNNVSDPWASFMGTAGHAAVEDMFKWDNVRRLGEGMEARWVPEQKVTPDPGPDPHPGTADLYDVPNRALVDHKFLGKSSMDKLKAHDKPKHVYFVQLLLYRRGYQYMGLPVDQIVLLAWPRTESFLDKMYVWHYIPVPEDEQLVDEVLKNTAVRQQMAELVKSGRVGIMDIPATPSDDSCIFCHLYKPQAAYDKRVFGCPGTVKPAY